MATLLFVDTNIWLDFYRANTEAGLSLLKRLKHLSKFLLVTDQVEAEFMKNRQDTILQSIGTLAPPQTISIPAFLTSDDVSDLDKRIDEAQSLVKKLKSRLPHILENPAANDPVFQICHEIFNKKDSYSYGRGHDSWSEVEEAALKRYQLGYPPRKSRDTSMGDAVNWEWIIQCAKITRSNIAIVSRDGDYGGLYGEISYLNDSLMEEFLDRVGKDQKIRLYHKLSVALREYKVTVTKKEQQEENRIMQASARGSSSAVGQLSDFEAARFAAFYNSASTPLALKAFEELLAAQQNAAIQGSKDAAEKEPE